MYSVKVDDNRRYATDAWDRVLYQERTSHPQVINHLHIEYRYRWTTMEVVEQAMNANEAEYRVRCLAREKAAAKNLKALLAYCPMGHRWSDENEQTGR